MDVVNISNAGLQGLSQYAAQSKSAANTKTNAPSAEQVLSDATKNLNSAYTVDISDDAKKAQAAAAETETVEDSTEESKGLSADQVKYLQDSIQMNQQTMLNLMIQALTESNDKLQGWLDEGAGILNFDGVQIDAYKFGMPEVATNPEDAAKAVADGGDWSVDAVATRIFDMASAIAGNDSEKLSALRAAVEEGFSQAGLTWNQYTGLDEMPEITEKTYNEIMSRFDKRAEELSGGSKVQEPVTTASEITN